MTKNSKTTATATEELATLPGDTLALMQQYADVDSGHVDTSVLSPPFLSIAQPPSPELNASQDGYIDDLKLGHFFVKGRTLGDTLMAVVCYGDQNYVEWTPDRRFVEKYPITSTRIHECKKGEGKAQYKDFTPEGNQLVKTYNLVLLVQDKDDWIPVVLAAKATQYRPAAELHAAVSNRHGGKVPSFFSMVRLRTVSKSNNDGTWFIFGHQILDEIAPEDVIAKGAELAKLASSGSLNNNPADSAYSATAYDNKEVIDQNTVDTVAESMA